MNWQAVGFVLVGVLLRTFLPLIVKNLKLIQAGKPTEKFELKYLFPPAATVALNVLALGLSAITQAGFLEEIAGMAWYSAVLFGVGGQEVLREIQKLFTS